jgi:hypothetical protein
MKNINLFLLCFIIITIGEQKIITKDRPHQSQRKSRIKKSTCNHEISDENNNKSENYDLEDNYTFEDDNNNDISDDDDNYDNDDHVCSGDCCSGDNNNTPD